MAVVGVVLHREKADALELAREATSWLRERGHHVRLLQEDADASGLAEWACKEDDFFAGLDVALSLGGDGTMLRTVDLVSAHGVPVLGVNVGQLGYLTEVEPSGLHEALDRFVRGSFSIEERMMLCVDVRSPSGGVPEGTHRSLNEAVLEKNEPGHTVRLAVSINDRFFKTYAADGLIVATPTGSTAYSLSARGPIVSPRHRALLLTPVAPHTLFDRPLVLDASESIHVEVIDGRPAMLSVDGNELGELVDGDSVTCTAGSEPARLVTFDGRDFHQILKAKFGLADR